MQKNCHYRRVAWISETEQNIGEIIEQCIENFPEEELPRFDIGEGLECVVARHSADNGVRYLHFISFEAGAPVAVLAIATDEATDDGDVAEQEPEDGHEFIHSQLFCVVQDNNLVWVTHNSTLKEGSIRNILASLIQHSNLDDAEDFTKFGFQVVLDERVVMDAFRSGIEEIDLGLGAFRPTLERISEGGELPEDGIVRKLINIVGARPTAEDLEAAEDIEGKLVLRPGRDWSKPRVVNLMTNMSSEIFENYEDEFSIRTKSGVRLTRDKMSVKRSVNLAGNKRVLNSMQVDRNLRLVFHSLGEGGIFDV